MLQWLSGGRMFYACCINSLLLILCKTQSRTFTKRASNYINSITDAQYYSELSDTDSESSDDDNSNVLVHWLDPIKFL